MIQCSEALHPTGSSTLQCATAQTSGYSKDTFLEYVFVIFKNFPNAWLMAILKTLQFGPAAQKKTPNRNALHKSSGMWQNSIY